MRMFRTLLMSISIIVCLSVKGFAQQQNAWQVGENIRLTISYTFGFIELKAAQANITANACKYEGKDAVTLEIGAKTIKAFKAFKVRDTLRAIVDAKTMEPYFTQVQSHEDDYFASFQTTYKKDENGENLLRIKKYKRDGLKKDTTIRNEKMYLDVVTILYGLRNTDFSKIYKNQKMPMPSVFQMDLYDLYWRYAGKELITLRKGETYKCLKICPYFVEGDLFDKGEVMTIWLTDDQNKIPILIESKLKIGSIRAVMENVKGNKYPMTSKVAKQ